MSNRQSSSAEWWAYRGCEPFSERRNDNASALRRKADGEMMETLRDIVKPSI